MKVFLSWSGNTSHQVAKRLRDWLPSVIQNIEPYVSSEDIDKGARWSTDIAKELENSTFGILCVTKENMNAPWLNFEAGALSKAMDKAYVTPFLFDVKRSEVNGPVLQFQSTIFEREDIHKMLKTINKALDGNKLPDERLDKTFDVWFPQLESELSNIAPIENPKQPAKTPTREDLMEEILELTRINQKLLRAAEDRQDKSQEITQAQFTELSERLNSLRNGDRKRHKHFHPMILEEIFMFTKEFEGVSALTIVLSFWKDDFPWLYDAGISVVKTLESEISLEKKKEALMRFERLMEFTFEHPMMRDFFGGKSDYRMYHREVHHLLMRYLHE